MISINNIYILIYIHLNFIKKQQLYIKMAEEEEDDLSKISQRELTPNEESMEEVGEMAPFELLGEIWEGEGEGEMEEEDLQTVFSNLEQEYYNTVARMMKVEAFKIFVDPYTRLFDALEIRQRHNEQLDSTNTLLQEKVTDYENKMQKAIELTTHDSQTIIELKKDIADAWLSVDAAHAREQNAHETIENLRNQIERLNKEIDHRTRLMLDQNEDSSASKHQEAMLRERERLYNEIEAMKEQLAASVVYHEQLEKQKSEANLRILDLQHEVERITTENNRQKKIIVRNETDIANYIITISTKDNELESYNNQLLNTKKTVTRLETLLRNEKDQNEKFFRENVAHLNQIQNMREQIQDHIAKIKNLNQDLGQRKYEAKRKEEEIVKTRNELTQITKIQETISKKLALCESQKSNVDQELIKSKKQNDTLEREIEHLVKQFNQDKKSLDMADREKEILKTNNMKLSNEMGELSNNHKILEQVNKRLNFELEEVRLDLNKCYKKIELGNKEHNKEMATNLDLNQKILDLKDEMKLKIHEVCSLKKLLVEAEGRIRMIQNQYEEIRSERNQLNKNLIEAQDNISELKDKLRVCSHQIEQLKEDITMKEIQLIREQFALKKCDKEKENLRIDLNKTKNELSERRHEIQELFAQVGKLEKLLRLAEQDKTHLKKEMENIMNERDILGTQLVRRNDELGLLYDKIRILSTALNKGEAQYAQRLDDIRLLKLEIKRLRQEKYLLSKNITNMTDLRQEILYLERDLTRERLKCHALEEELQNPLNIHRWRKLKSCDPDAYEMIKKIHFLQKRLLNKGNQYVQKENQLRETERLYFGLRKILSRQPGPDFGILLQKTQESLRNSNREKRCLEAENLMYESQMSDHKFDLERVKNELKDVKNKYFFIKKVFEKIPKNKLKMKNDEVEQKKKVLGGGFVVMTQTTLITNKPYQ